jgi:hypothetical protein
MNGACITPRARHRPVRGRAASQCLLLTQSGHRRPFIAAIGECCAEFGAALFCRHQTKRRRQLSRLSQPLYGGAPKTFAAHQNSLGRALLPHLVLMVAQRKFRCLLGTEKDAEDFCRSVACNHHVGGLGRGEREAESLAGAMSIGAAGKGNMRLWSRKNRLPSGNVLSRFLEFLHAITTS